MKKKYLEMRMASHNDQPSHYNIHNYTCNCIHNWSNAQYCEYSNGRSNSPYIKIQKNSCKVQRQSVDMMTTV